MSHRRHIVFVHGAQDTYALSRGHKRVDPSAHSCLPSADSRARWACEDADAASDREMELHGSGRAAHRTPRPRRTWHKRALWAPLARRNVCTITPRPLPTAAMTRRVTFKISTHAHGRRGRAGGREELMCLRSSCRTQRRGHRPRVEHRQRTS